MSALYAAPWKSATTLTSTGFVVARELMFAHLDSVVNRFSTKVPSIEFGRRREMKKHFWHIGWQCRASA
jgi:hypothetical protein